MVIFITNSFFYSDVIKNKTNTLSVNSTNPATIFISEGNKLVDQRDYSHALEKYYAALKLDPNCFLCYYKLGRVYWILRDYGSSVSCLEAAIRLNPKWSLPYETLGDIFLKSKLYFPNRLNKAAENYKRAIELEPSRMELRLRLAQCYENGGEAEKAAKEYETILSIDPKNSAAISSLEKLRNKVVPR